MYNQFYFNSHPYRCSAKYGGRLPINAKENKNWSVQLILCWKFQSQLTGRAFALKESFLSIKQHIWFKAKTSI